MLNDYGFSIVKEDDLPTNVENSNTIYTLERDMKNKTLKYEQRIQDILDAIIPFLKSLKENPTHEYIKWPNRVEAIDKFKQKLQDIAWPERVTLRTSVPPIKESKKDGSKSNT